MKAGLVDRSLYITAGALLVALLGAVTLGIVSRALNRPLSWTEEASGFLMVWLVCFGWMIASRHNAHIRIRYFQDKLPPKYRRWMEMILQFAVALLGVVVAWSSIHLIMANSDVDAVTLPLSTAWMYVPLLPAGLVTLMQAGIEVYKQAFCAELVQTGGAA
jgi:TRAP-type C4-dicarboxylate transport system permease small subunit